MQIQGASLVVYALTLLVAGQLNVVFAKTRNEQDDQARQKLADKLLKLGRSLDMKEARYPESGGSGKDFDADTGNSYLSNTTYHSYVWDYCENWLGGQYCERWIDPYVSKHGQDGDRSPLEGTVWDEYKKRRNKIGEGPDGSTQYKIWLVKSEGQLTDVDGKLERRYLKEWKLLPDVQQKVEKVGEDTAQRNVNATFDQKGEGGSRNSEEGFANMEALRVMASRWTRMLRNRLVASLGQQRVMEPPIEFALGEDKHNCDEYLKALRTEMDKSGLEERIDPQPRLDQLTRVKKIEERYDLCVKMRQQSVYAINPQVVGDKIEQGGPESEPLDQEKTRLNIALIDFVGIDPNNLPKKNKIKKEDYEQELTEWQENATKADVKYRTNAEQLQEYNDNLVWAAQGMKEVIARAPVLRDNTADILKHQIKIGSVNAVKLNSLTPEMREELDGVYPRTPSNPGGKPNPEEYMEQLPTEITISKK